MKEEYQELIRLLRDENNCNVLDYVDDAADAIETLMRERDAAIADIEELMSESDEGACAYCAWYGREKPCPADDTHCLAKWRGVKMDGGGKDA